MSAAGRGPLDPVDFTKDGRCTRCGGCCSSIIPLSPEEADALKRFAKENDINPRLPDGSDVVYLHCPFLDRHDDGTCTCVAYDVRPAVCRSFSCHNTARENAKSWVRMFGEDPPPAPKNVWSVFNRTGLRFDNTEIPYDMAPLCRIQTDDGAEYQFQVGRPASFLMEDGERIPPVIITGLFQDGIQGADPGKGRLRFYPFARMSEILLDTCVVREPNDKTPEDMTEGGRRDA